MRATRSLIQIPTERPSIEAVRDQFETWRKNRKRRSRIPEFLWEAAAGLCREHSICQVSGALGLNYSRLKNRVTGGRERNVALEQGADLGFVSLDVGLPIRASAWWVEMEAPNGSKMRMSFKGGRGDFDPVEVSRAFWRQGR